MPSSPILTQTPCITLGVSGGVLKAVPLISADAANLLQCLEDGLYAQALFTDKCVLRRSSIDADPQTPGDFRTVVEWTDEDVDTNGLFDPGSPTVVTVKRRGRYYIAATWSTGRAGGGGAGGLIIQLVKGGAVATPVAFGAFYQNAADTGSDAGCHAETVLALDAGDQVQVAVEQTSLLVVAWATLAVVGLCAL